jgi:predicted MPP superfamily phosphohydrolase
VRPAQPRARRRIRTILWCLLAAVALTIAYGMLIGARRIEVTRQEVPLAGLPRALDGVRVVQLSDLHVCAMLQHRTIRRVVALANAENPDLVLITGDFVSYRSSGYLPAAARELRALRARLGVFGCLGNHEHWEGVARVRPMVEAGGVTVLVNESREVADGLRIAAVDDLMSGQPDLPAATAKLPKDAAVLLLSHNPAILPQIAEHPWLVLAGHTHGSQVALPFLGPRGTARLPGVPRLMYAWEWLGVRARHGRVDAVVSYRYPAGWYGQGHARLYVNRGTGFNQGWPVRLNCRPEIACFTLRAPRAPPSSQRRHDLNHE